MTFRELRPLRFSAATKRWIEEPETDRSADVATLTLVTWNVWFGAVSFDARAKAALAVLRDAEADVIALQEVTDEFLRYALSEDWLRRSYAVSDATGRTVKGYGVVIFSRIPVLRMASFDLPTGMRRRVLVSTFSVNKRPLAIATAHLESLRESAGIRLQQLQRIFALLDKYENATFVGDFNFDPSWPENEHIEDGYVDLWPMMHADDPGQTHGYLKPGDKLVRFDRILLRCKPGVLRVKELTLIGTSEISAGMYPSDHYGLRTALSVAKGSSTS